MQQAMQQTGLYRRPKDPGGYAGGYQWRPTVMGLCLLGLVQAGVTQGVAHALDYQQALGAPLARVAGYRLYAPHQWAVWVWKHSSSRHAAVRQVILGGALGVVLGSCVVVIPMLALNMRRVRKLTENTEDLHGSARWASHDEIQATGLVAARQGVYIGGWFDRQAERLHYLRHNGPEHVLAFAPTRSGKGVGLVIPTLLAWSESVVCYDIKGENWAKTAGYRAQCGHLCFKFSPVEPEGGSRFNPLAEVRLGTMRDVSDAQNIADMIVRTGEDSPQERYWQDAAASIMTGMILHVCYAAHAERRVASLAELAGVFTKPGQTFRDTLGELLSHEHDSTLR